LYLENIRPKVHQLGFFTEVFPVINLSYFKILPFYLNSNNRTRRQSMAKGRDKGGKDKAQNKDKVKLGIKEKRKIKKEKAAKKKGL